MEQLEGLNSAQKRAALHAEGPLLIIAGAGAGKTKTIVHRISTLIHRGVDPRHILAITFTNKAAAEMRERVLALLNKTPGLETGRPQYEVPTVKTFHSLGVQLLKENARRLGLTRHGRRPSQDGYRQGHRCIPRLHDVCLLIGGRPSTLSLKTSNEKTRDRQLVEIPSKFF